MNKKTIKEIKTIYSGKINATNKATRPEINGKKQNIPRKQFFTSVIEKLNIQ